MKKYSILFLLVLAVMLFCMSIPAFAAEETEKTDNQKISEIVNSIDGVGESRVFAYGDCVIVAVRTKGVYLKSFETELNKIASEKIKEAFPQYTNIKLSTSLKVFRAIEQLNRMLEDGKTLDEIGIPFDRENPIKPMPKPLPQPRTNG